MNEAYSEGLHNITQKQLKLTGTAESIKAIKAVIIYILEKYSQ